jgi:hypothetical protein
VSWFKALFLMKAMPISRTHPTLLNTGSSVHDFAAGLTYLIYGKVLGYIRKRNRHHGVGPGLAFSVGIIRVEGLREALIKSPMSVPGIRR